MYSAIHVILLLLLIAVVSAGAHLTDPAVDSSDHVETATEKYERECAAWEERQRVRKARIAAENDEIIAEFNRNLKPGQPKFVLKGNLTAEEQMSNYKYNVAVFEEQEREDHLRVFEIVNMESIVFGAVFIMLSIVSLFLGINGQKIIVNRKAKLSFIHLSVLTTVASSLKAILVFVFAYSEEEVSYLYFLLIAHSVCHALFTSILIRLFFILCSMLKSFEEMSLLHSHKWVDTMKTFLFGTAITMFIIPPILIALSLHLELPILILINTVIFDLVIQTLLSIVIPLLGLVLVRRLRGQPTVGNLPRPYHSIAQFVNQISIAIAVLTILRSVDGFVELFYEEEMMLQFPHIIWPVVSSLDLMIIFIAQFYLCRVIRSQMRKNATEDGSTRHCESITAGSNFNPKQLH